MTNSSIRLRSNADRSSGTLKRLAGRVALVTGGGAGIGRETVGRLSKEGAAVAVVDVDFSAAQSIADEIDTGLPIEADVSVPSTVETAIEKCVDRFGQVDIIFNNAGIVGEQQPLHEYDIENWRRVTSVNGDGVFYVLKYGISAMLQSGGGSIINMSSTAALAAQQNISAYTYAKAGLAGLTRSAAVEYAKSGIRVNAIAPTAVLTPMVENFIEQSEDPQAFRQERENWNPIPGWPLPSDIAGVVAFLASDDSSWITGHVLPIDGGYLVR